MPNLLQTYFQNAQLSMASYSDLAVGMSRDQYITALKEAGFSEPLATKFADSYSILSVSPDEFLNANGFSATLFQKNEANPDGSHDKILAIRGTNGLFGDIITDATLALLGDVSGQYNSLQDYYLQLKDELKLLPGEQFTVTGHSLGGFLAQAFTVDHPLDVTHAYTYNAPGVGGVVIDLLHQIGVVGSTIPSAQITNTISENGFLSRQGLAP